MSHELAGAISLSRCSQQFLARKNLAAAHFPLLWYSLPFSFGSLLSPLDVSQSRLNRTSSRLRISSPPRCDTPKVGTSGSHRYIPLARFPFFVPFYQLSVSARPFDYRPRSLLCHDRQRERLTKIILLVALSSKMHRRFILFSIRPQYRRRFYILDLFECQPLEYLIQTKRFRVTRRGAIQFRSKSFEESWRPRFLRRVKRSRNNFIVTVRSRKREESTELRRGVKISARLKCSAVAVTERSTLLLQLQYAFWFGLEANAVAGRAAITLRSNAVVEQNIRCKVKLG